MQLLLLMGQQGCSRRSRAGRAGGEEVKKGASSHCRVGRVWWLVWVASRGGVVWVASRGDVVWVASWGGVVWVASRGGVVWGASRGGVVWGASRGGVVWVWEVV